MPRRPTVLQCPCHSRRPLLLEQECCWVIVITLLYPSLDRWTVQEHPCNIIKQSTANREEVESSFDFFHETTAHHSSDQSATHPGSQTKDKLFVAHLHMNCLCHGGSINIVGVELERFLSLGFLLCKERCCIGHLNCSNQLVS
jgi:hypothetical protein